MDRDSPIYRKKKPSSTSKASSRSDHKHEYEPCILKYLLYSWGECCRICGRIRFKHSNDNELLRPEALSKPAIGLKDYLSESEMKEKFPGIRVYELDYSGSETIFNEILG